MRVNNLYNFVLQKKSKVCIDAIISSLEQSSFFIEAKIKMLTNFKEVLVYEHIDRYLAYMEKVFLGDYEFNPLVSNLNPILCGLLILNSLNGIAISFPVAKFRIEHLVDIITHQIRSVLVSIYMPVEIKSQIKLKDLDGKDSFYYMEMLDSYQLLDTKVMDRILKDFWSSNIDANGSFF